MPNERAQREIEISNLFGLAGLLSYIFATSESKL